MICPFLMSILSVNSFATTHQQTSYINNNNMRTMHLHAAKDADMTDEEREVAMEKALKAMTAFSNKYAENTGTYLTQSTGNTHAIEISDGIQHIFSDESISTPTPATPPPLTTPRARKTYFYDTTPNSDSGSPFRAGLMCGTSIFPLLRRLEDDDEHDNETRIPIRRTNSEDLPTRLLEKVDFRTGLSGHVALNRAHRHHHTSAVNRSHVRMMGEHRGIAAIKNMRKKKNSGLYSP